MQQFVNDKKIRDTIENWDKSSATPSFNKEKVWQDIERKQLVNKRKKIVIPQWGYTVAASIIFFILGQGVAITITENKSVSPVEEKNENLASIHLPSNDIDSLNWIIHKQQEQLAFLKSTPSDTIVIEVLSEKVKKQMMKQYTDLENANSQLASLTGKLESFHSISQENVLLRDSILQLNENIATIEREHTNFLAKMSKESKQYMLDIDEEELKSTPLYTMETSNKAKKQQSIRVSFFRTEEQDSEEKVKKGLFRSL